MLIFEKFIKKLKYKHLFLASFFEKVIKYVL